MSKKVMRVVLSVVMFVVICSSAYAQDMTDVRGSVIVPNIRIQNWAPPSHVTKTTINITNITNETVTCRVLFFDHDGNDLTTNGVLTTGSTDNWVTIATGGGVFELPPHSTRGWSVDNNTASKSIMGHAIIEWTSADKRLRKALVAGVWTTLTINSSYSEGNYLINCGQPF